MSKKNSNEHFNSGHFIDFISEFMKETDRAAVILGAAKIDLQLYQLLIHFFVASPGSKDELLDGDSPLGTFSSKIHIAYRLGLIDNDFARALHMIRKIRNLFAHEVSECSLDSGSHRDRIKELVAPFKHLEIFLSALEMEKKSHSLTGASADFRVILGFIVITIDSIQTDCLPISNKDSVSLVKTLEDASLRNKDDARD